MKNIIRFLLIFFFLFGVSILNNVYAADFKTDYQIEYNLSHFQESLTSNVRFNIKITNLKGDVYVNKFAISFPKSFAISNLNSSDDHGAITPKLSSDDLNTKVEMEFSNPNIGKDSVNNFYLNFDQSNLFKINGNVWEVALPVIENKQEGTYQIVVTLPLNTDKKISISKPIPSAIDGNKIVWINPQTKTIYAVFGDNQIYDTELIYHLKNDEIFPVVTEIAFPPDTIYQKTFINSLSSEPNSIYQDEDGNYLAKYQLKPLESKTIIFKGIIQIFSSSRVDLQPQTREQINKQKDYLISQQKYWTIKDLNKISSLNTPREIYDFTVNSLKYNYKKVSGDYSRLGAEGVLKNPDQAVCLEFSDLFVATSREKGILSREIQGYGFSYDPQLQPLSLVSDVLHSWPEYFNQESGLWIPIDPTWENTSGIDYFTSFDLNHIVFAIHGKKPDYPLPAGMYKIADSKDITIKAVTVIPDEKRSLVISDYDLDSKISNNKTYQGKLTVKNKSNIYLREIPIEIQATDIDINNKKTVIKSLAPYEEKEINFEYQSLNKNKNKQGKIVVLAFNNKLNEETIEIIPYYYLIVVKIGGSLIAFTALVLIIKKIRENSR